MSLLSNACRGATAVALSLFLAWCTHSHSLADDGFQLQDAPGQSLTVRLDGKPVARYEYAFDPERLDQTNKPFLHILDATGTMPITNGAGGYFPHHRGIFIGASRLTVGGRPFNLWGMSGGVQVHRGFVAQQAAADSASFTSEVEWNATGGERLLDEQRTFIFHRRPVPAMVLVDVISTLKAVGGDVIFDGDPEHAGVHYRPATELDKTQTTYLFPRDGDDPRRDKDLPWVALTHVLADKTYTVQQMNAPDNPRDTIWSAYRDYGRFGAFVKAEIKQNESLTLRYRFSVLAGAAPSRDELQRAWAQYAHSDAARAR